MKRGKQLIVVGDRVLIRPDDSRERTASGLYLPQGVESKEKVQGGYVVKTGPGYPLPYPGDDEPWERDTSEPRYLPLQAEEGDYALFLRKAAIDVEFDGVSYLIVPQNAILLLERDDLLNGFDEQ